MILRLLPYCTNKAAMTKKLKEMREDKALKLSKHKKMKNKWTEQNPADKM